LSPAVTAIVAIVIGLVLTGIVWAIVSLMRSTTSSSFLTSDAAPEAQDRMRPTLVDFHVHGDTAKVYYGVPLPADEIGTHLRDVLCHDASLVLHEKRFHGLPIDQVTRAEVYGQRDGEPVEVAVLELEEPGVIPEIVAPDLVPHASATGYDPLALLGEQDLGIHPGVATRVPDEGLPPFAGEILYAKSVEARLRAAGIDPYDVSLSTLARGLLQIGGYQVTPGSDGPADTYLATKAGSVSLVVVHESRPGDHPELPESAVNSFVIEVAQTNPQRALLITDMFGPYMIYEKERNDPRCRFITRERLQPFVDSFALQ
jgi:hypothetical protein